MIAESSARRSRADCPIDNLARLRSPEAWILVHLGHRSSFECPRCRLGCCHRWARSRPMGRDLLLPTPSFGHQGSQVSTQCRCTLVALAADCRWVFISYFAFSRRPSPWRRPRRSKRSTVRWRSSFFRDFLDSKPATSANAFAGVRRPWSSSSLERSYSSQWCWSCGIPGAGAWMTTPCSTASVAFRSPGTSRARTPHQRWSQTFCQFNNSWIVRSR